MPIQTDLSVSPYFDDYSDQKDYYKILFRPGTAVQTRELNQLQTMLQKQVERFGDNIFKRGTIIDGCDITFHSVFPYVKIKDNESDGAPVNVNRYLGYNLKNQANITPLIATVTTAVTGFESQNPNLNTLYVRYINSGVANVGGVETEQTTFAANQQLTVYDPDMIIEKVTSYNDSSGFSNTDSVVFMSAIAIQNSSGGKTFANNFYVGDHITDGVANVQVVTVDSTSNASHVILRLKPRADDLQLANTQKWTLAVNTNIQSTNNTPSSIATITDIIGTGAAGTLRTGSLGEVDQIAITQRGAGYTVLPTVSIASKTATTGQITSANLVPQTYLATITIANSALSPVGTGYAMTVGPGVIYQKGYFARVNEHLVVVEKYANTPDLKAVGFDTTEEIINYSQDPDLLDNATGAPNETAPGANRLQLTPKLVVMSKAEADANSEFFSVAEFTEGQPYKQNRQTVYNIVGNEMARRSYEESGNYVLDQFILNTKSDDDIGNEPTSFKVQIDPGVAYIKGNRVETLFNYQADIAKGTDTIVATNAVVSLNYGNYVRVKQVGGTFNFKSGDLVSLYPTAKSYITTSPGAAPSAAGLGTALGTARIRSMTHESGTPGSAEAVYKIYLFDIQLTTGNNFKSVRSIFYNGTNKGVADCVLENNNAVLKDNNLSSLIKPAGVKAVKQANNLSYVYRTISNTETIALEGTITFTTTGGETFPYTANSTLSTPQEKEIIVVPLANVELSANLSGEVACQSSNATVTGTLTEFSLDLQTGDFIKIANASASVICQVNNIVNNTVLTVRNAPASTITGNAVIYFPQNVPISLERSDRGANVDINSNTMVVTIGAEVNTATTVAVAYNVRSSNSAPVAKTVNRDKYVRVKVSNNVGGNSGPWALGVPDIFRLKKVYLGPNTTFEATDSGVSDITGSFYIDHNQTEDYYGIGYLYLRPGASAGFVANSALLVEFDYFTVSGEGIKSPGGSGTYAINDGIALADSSSSINTLEIPEVHGAKGDYYDLRDSFDFRPLSANTVAVGSNAATAPINPTDQTATTRFSNADKKFPAPDSTLSGTVEYYVGRVDRIVIEETGNFHVIAGAPGIYNPPLAPDNALTINVLTIPPYPSLPYRLSSDMIEFLDAGIANEKYTNKRITDYRIRTSVTAAQRNRLQPRGYTMVDIGKLERRIESLEYYTSFTLAEVLAQKRAIPSSTGLLDRFKFGYFVDPFSTYNYSDTTNPGYKASILEGFLCPYVDEINLPSDPVDPPTFPYVEYVLVSQPKATDGPVVPKPTSNTGTNTNDGTITVTPISNTSNTQVVVQTIASVLQRNKTRNLSDTAPYVYEEFFYTMSNTAGPVGLYLNSRDNNMAIEVFRSLNQNGPWTSFATSASAGAITSSDIIAYKLSEPNFKEIIEHPGTLSRKTYGPVGYFIEDQFKLLFSHDPKSGRYYKVRVYKGNNHGAGGSTGRFEYLLRYPTDSTINITTNSTLISPTTSYTTDYGGIATIGSALNMIYNDAYAYQVSALPLVTSPTPVPTSYVSSEQGIDVVVTGLRATTIHTVYLDGVDITSRVKQEGKLLGSTVVSDVNGIIKFILFFGADVNATTEIEKAASAVLQTAGTKTLKVQSSDGLSRASTTIIIPEYVAKEIENTAPTPIMPPTTSQEVSFSDILNQDLGWFWGRASREMDVF